ncbi:hypothetical protein DY218_32640 [Streptomyces triticagri]|uniref:Helix-turn-helix domain-containing protein n=1 Tax=Streptomyces triticagri TaxID=2293568 RepID=A0A372LV08_9ACTN|nr:hypothetical protein [Streptomyces triticagri]RFU82494.1 hypothetical protein DY218_32640 [Streptomyces triticagri]
MAYSQSNARLRAPAGSPAPRTPSDGRPSSGVIHVRSRLTSDFTVIANSLVQRGGSAVTIGVAAYILSLPDGAPVSIRALCAHFSEGEILISRALRELEAAGYLERRRERMPDGSVRTRTFFYDVPGGEVVAKREAASVAPTTDPEPDPEPEPEPPHRREPTEPDSERATPEPARRTDEADRSPRRPSPPPDPRAIAVLAALRRTDPRLVLSAPEAARLAPAVSEWFDAGVDAARITELLTNRLPASFFTRPAAILAFRLRATPLPAPPPPEPHPGVPPLQNCEDCDRAFRAPAPGTCRACSTARRPRTAAAA